MSGPLLAQVSSSEAASAATEVTFRSIEWALPTSPLGWALATALAGIATAVTLRLAVVESRTIGWASVWLATLRLATLAILGLIACDPHERLQRDVTEPSRVALLVDTSSSMAEPLRVSRDDVPSRAEAVTEMLRGADGGSSLLSRLAEKHRVDLYTFDSTLRSHGALAAGPFGSVAEGDADEGDAGSDAVAGREPSTGPALGELLRPVGPKTALGDALAELSRTAGGPTLAGIAVFSDGRSNSGDGPGAIGFGDRRQRPTPVATVGVGDTRRPPAVTVVDLRTPQEVRYSSELERQDAFDVTAFVVARADDGASSGPVTVSLFRRPAGTDAATDVEIDRRVVTATTDGVPTQVDFPVEPEGAGRFVYTVRVAPGAGLEDFDADDNAAERIVDVIERNTAVLAVAGGPTRDYRFVTTLLDRAATFDVDVWLQTVRPSDVRAVSQDAAEVLVEFPPSFPLRPSADVATETGTSAGEYDVVVFFDPDWARLTPEDQERLTAWVAEERGGVVLVAGDVHQTRVGQGGGERPTALDLYPIVPAPPAPLTAAPPVAERAWPVLLTEPGRRAGFMDLSGGAADDPDEAGWPSLFRTVPTAGVKSLATIYATLDDPNAGGEAVVAAAQPYGGGRVVYLGTPETWRLRKLGAGTFERFWVGLLSDAASGRRRRSAGGALLLDRREYEVGQTAVVRVERPRSRGTAEGADPVLFVFGPDGEPLGDGGLRMEADRVTPGQFVADVPLAAPGEYTFRAESGAGPMLTATAEVVLPALERRDPRLDRETLTRLAERTSGAYFDLAEAATGLPGLFSESATRVVRLDEGREALWDRAWVLATLAGLLSLEWLSRKLLKLS